MYKLDSLYPLISRPRRKSVSALIEGEAVNFETIEEKFDALATSWKVFLRGRSSSNEYNHAAYLQIIGMGTEVIPILLRCIENGDGDWILALKYITGEKVTTSEIRGDFKAIRDAWLRWGKDNGFRDH